VTTLGAEALALTALCVAVVAFLSAVVAVRKRAWLVQISAVESALTRAVAEVRVKQDQMEARLAALPTTNEFADIRVNLARVEVQQDALMSEVKGNRAATRRIEDFLMKSRDHDPKL
jgi:hypothetical protein